MKKVTESLIVPYGPEDMYRMVNDIKSYPLFLPWCEGTHIIKETPEEVCARIDIKRGFIRQSFTTLNHLTPYHRIEMTLVEGPLEYLRGAWEFDTITGEPHSHEKSFVHTKVSLQLDFEFGNSWIGSMMNNYFEEIGRKFVKAFKDRADHVYGRAKTD